MPRLFVELSGIQFSYLSEHSVQGVEVQHVVIDRLEIDLLLAAFRPHQLEGSTGFLVLTLALENQRIGQQLAVQRMEFQQPYGNGLHTVRLIVVGFNQLAPLCGDAPDGGKLDRKSVV